jgi:hypothetical protein
MCGTKGISRHACLPVDLILVCSLQRNFSSLVFRLKVFEEEYQGAKKIKATVQGVSPIDWSKDGWVRGKEGVFI